MIKTATATATATAVDVDNRVITDAERLAAANERALIAARELAALEATRTVANAQSAAESAYSRAKALFCLQLSILPLLSVGAFVGTYYAGRAAAADNGSVPNKIAINPGTDGYGSLVYAAKTECTGIAYNYMDPTFANLIGLNANNGSNTQLIMDVMRFACNLASNVTLGSATFQRPENVCVDYTWEESGPDKNTGSLKVLFQSLAHKIGASLDISLLCKDAEGFGGYVALALFAAFAAAVLLVTGIYTCVKARQPLLETFVTEAAARERLLQQTVVAGMRYDGQAFGSHV